MGPTTPCQVGNPKTSLVMGPWLSQTLLILLREGRHGAGRALTDLQGLPYVLTCPEAPQPLCPAPSGVPRACHPVARHPPSPHLPQQPQPG